MHPRRFLALAIVVLAAGPAAAQMTSINGTVVASGTSAPLTGITVEAWNANVPSKVPVATTSTPA